MFITLPIHLNLNKEDFLISSMYFRYLPFEESRALRLKKTESPSPKNALRHVWLKFAQWFWRRRYLNFVNVFALFRNYLPFEKGGALHLNNIETPLPTDALCQVWSNWPSGSGEEDENVKILQTEGRTDRQTDDGRKAISKAHLSCQLR